MHLLPPRQGDTHAWVLERWPGSRWRSAVLEVLSRLFNYQGPKGAPSVTVELARRGEGGRPSRPGGPRPPRRGGRRALGALRPVRRDGPRRAVRRAAALAVLRI